MPFFNCPSGVLGPSDIDHAYALGNREEPEPETCAICGAGENEDCEEGCTCAACKAVAERKNVRRAG